MNLKSLQSVAETYLAMLRPKAAASVSKPKWVPASITEENVAAFVQAVTEARKANKSVLKFKGKKYAIKSIKEEASEEADQGTSKKIQDMDAENAPKQASDEVPAEVKEEDAEEIKMANHDEKEAEADEMPELDEPKLSEEEHEDEEDSDKKDDNGDDEVEAEVEVEEELVGNQHKLDMDKDGEIDAEDLKKLRGEETEEGEEEEDEKDSEEDEKEINETQSAIVTRKNPDGSYNEVGMNTRRVVHGSHSNILKKAKEFAKGPHRVELFHGDRVGYGAPHKVIHSESTQLTGEQTISSVAATYAAMVNENVAGDPHAATLSSKANSASALAHTSHSETHHEDARDAHHAAAEHYRVYAHNHHDPLVRSASKIHHEFHRSMSNHHMLNLVSSDMDKEAHDMAAKLYGKKSVEEGTAADAEAGPEVMDPATQKMKDAHDDETEIKDGVPGAAQDGGDKVSPADKPAAANKSAALPKVPVITAPVTTNESTENMNNNTTIKSVGEAYIQMNEDVHSSKFQHPMNSKKGHLERLAHHATLSKHHASFIDNNKGIPYDVHFKKADHHKAYADDHAKAAIEHGASPDEILKHGKGVIQWFKHPKWGT